MSIDLEFIKLGNKNKFGFESFLPDPVTGYVPSGEFCFGVSKDEKKYGVVELKKNGKDITVSGIWIDYSAENTHELLTDIMGALIENADAWGFGSVSCNFTDDEPGITGKVLKNAGFTGFKEMARVFRIDAYSMGTLLRDGQDFVMMRRESVRILDEGRARVFHLAPEKVTAQFVNLVPEPHLSFLTLNEDDTVGSSVCVSALSDGSLYLSDISCTDGELRDLEGLLYLCFSAVFMEIYPNGEFYFPAVNPYLNNITEHILSPLGKGVEKQRIFSASVSLHEK
ncbi:MAG: hypothetical protein K5668_06175 [Lachnospiraceae bacterium]|nr:hypothetical protein [Lachnospiraceae bacterium]